MDLTAIIYYTAAIQRQTLAKVQIAVAKKMLDFYQQLSLEIINQMSPNVISNNPSNTGSLIDIRV
ncbi:MAG TPA: putative motility protein [Aquifex sp.]|nr:putative motility protein [Aquifex sp.]